MLHSSEENDQNINTDTFLIERPSPKEAIFHVFGFPSTKKTIAYYHEAAGFRTKKHGQTPFEQEIMIPGQGSTSKPSTNTSQKVMRQRKGI